MKENSAIILVKFRGRNSLRKVLSFITIKLFILTKTLITIKQIGNDNIKVCIYILKLILELNNNSLKEIFLSKNIRER